MIPGDVTDKEQSVRGVKVGDTAVLSWVQIPVRVIDIKGKRVWVQWIEKPSVTHVFSLRKNGKYVDVYGDMHHGMYLIWNH